MKTPINHGPQIFFFLLNLQRVELWVNWKAEGAKSVHDQGKKKFHNSRGHKAFSVPRIPEGEAVFPANKFITTPAEPAPCEAQRAGGSWRGPKGRRERQKGILAPSSGPDQALILTVTSKGRCGTEAAYSKESLSFGLIAIPQGIK